MLVAINLIRLICSKHLEHHLIHLNSSGARCRNPPSNPASATTPPPFLCLGSLKDRLHFIFSGLLHILPLEFPMCDILLRRRTISIERSITFSSLGYTSMPERIGIAGNQCFVSLTKLRTRSLVKGVHCVFRNKLP